MPQDDLEVKMDWTVDVVFDLRPEKPTVRVRKDHSPKWRNQPLPPQRHGRDSFGVQYFTFDRASIKQAMRFLIDNAYVTVGDNIFRQVRGIPMGTNPAVFLANYYLFAYEYCFFRDALVVLNSSPSAVERGMVYAALEPFRFVVRFVDDLILISVTGPSTVERLLYVSQHFAGIHGIYPDCLVLVSSTVEGGRVLRALDVEVLPANTVCGPLVTRLYDKRRQPCFADAMNIRRFPPIESMLALSCKLNVFDSQFVRFSRLITEVNNFVAEVVLLLALMIMEGYPEGPLLGRCKTRVRTTSVLFGAARGMGQDTHGVQAWQQIGRPYSGMWPKIRDRIRIALLPPQQN